MALGTGALASSALPSAAAAQRIGARRAPILGLLGPTRELTDTTWLMAAIHDDRHYELNADTSLSLLERYIEPSREHTPEWRSFFRGAYGLPSWEPRTRLLWRLGGERPRGHPTRSAEPAFDLGVSLRAPSPIAPPAWAELAPVDWALGLAPEPDPLSIRPRKPCPRWKVPPQVTLVRYDGAESERLALVDCEGRIAPEAADRLAVLARPPGTPHPGLPLPDAPEQGAEDGEWLPQVRLLHPRMVWVVEKIAEAFPGKRIHLMSGYRRDGHSGFHGKGRALDVHVAGVPNEQLFSVCKSLRDVGCGFYPNNKFVHVDIRPYGGPRVLWIDVSEPGQPSQYVDGWPDLVAPGSAWLPR